MLPISDLEGEGGGNALCPYALNLQLPVRVQFSGEAHQIGLYGDDPLSLLQ